MHSIGADTIFSLGPIPVTNTMLAAWISSFVLLALALSVRLKLKIIPGKLQNIVEMLAEYIYDLCVSISDERRAKVFFPFIATFFIFILTCNWFGLLPTFGSLEVVKGDSHTVETEHAEEPHEPTEESEQSEHEQHKVPLLKGATSDLNLTFALAAVSFFMVQFFGFTMQGPIGWFKHYFHSEGITFKSATQIAVSGLLVVIYGFVGILEIALEPVKALSLSFRLFGNITAGETLVTSLTVINGTAIPFIAVPFLLLEVLVGVVQALVFSLLTLTFVSMITNKSH